jgi:hypothetical protein
LMDAVLALVYAGSAAFFGTLLWIWGWLPWPQ